VRYIKPKRLISNSCLTGQGVPCSFLQVLRMGHTPFGQPQIIFANKERLPLFQSHQQGNMAQYIHDREET
jgi:hypothetical protein